jgi:hypothetical protein
MISFSHKQQPTQNICATLAMIFALNNISLKTTALRFLRRLFACLFVLSPLSASAAEWNIIKHNDMDTNTITSIAIIKNENGETLEIYKDSVDAVRARFTLSRNLIQFPDNFCPTFQIDRGEPTNRSVNDAPCLSAKTWAEFILGYVKNGNISSSAVVGLMNGVGLRFRFRLENGDYHETLFSLRGSKRAMSAALGNGVSVTPLN